MGVICSAEGIINIIFNFIALVVIAEFDDFVYDGLKNETFKELMSKEFIKDSTMIHHTTSKKCSDDLLTEQIDPLGNPRPTKIRFSTRKCNNKCMFSFYKVIKACFLSFYFYYLPFIAIICSSAIGFFYNYHENKNIDQDYSGLNDLATHSYDEPDLDPLLMK